MKLGCADFTWPLMTHTDVVRHIAMLGFDGIDLGLMEGRTQIQPGMVRQDVGLWSGVIGERLGASGLEAADVFFVPSFNLTDLAANHPDRSERDGGYEVFLDMLDFARRIGAPGMTMNGGVPIEGQSTADSLKLSAQELTRRVEAAAAHDIEVRVEASVNSNTPTPEMAMELVEAVPGLKLTIDYCHFVYQDISESEVHPLLEHAAHFQCRGAAPGRMQVNFQENTIDYRDILQRLMAQGYDAYFSIEYVWIDFWDCNRTENTMETIQFRDFVQAVLAGDEYTPQA